MHKLGFGGARPTPDAAWTIKTREGRVVDLEKMCCISGQAPCNMYFRAVSDEEEDGKYNESAVDPA